MSEPVKRGPGRPRVDKMQRSPRVYKLDDSAGVAVRITVSLSRQQDAKIKRAAAANGLRPVEQLRRWIDEAVE